MPEVGSKLGMSRQAVYARAAYMRKKGVELPVKEIARGGMPKLNVEELNQIIRQNGDES